MAASEAVCMLCGRSALDVADAVKVCGKCILGNFPAVREELRKRHALSRAAFELPAEPPKSTGGVKCPLCSNECTMGEGERGYCGLRVVEGGKLRHLAGSPERGLLHWYRDPLPTNCVADWVCEGRKQRGCHNLAVFYASCTANCLFCQNWHYRRITPESGGFLSAEELAEKANQQTFCVCFFGGDPASQMPHALAASRLFAKRGIRVCWETNGMMHPRLLDAAVRHSLETGGCIKFDLKAFDEELHLALTGVSNQRTKENFARAAKRFGERPEPPLVVASTLLVPGYVDAEQVGKIARFIAQFDPRIPYALLAFAPQFFMSDMPYTSARHAREAEAAAKDAGLVNVRIGNRHLLGIL
jgi:pyruvate formate lyase activating enzyme